MIDYPWITCKYPGMYTQNRAGNMSLASILVKLCQLLGCVLCYCILITCWPSMQENSLYYEEPCPEILGKMWVKYMAILYQSTEDNKKLSLTYTK